MKYRAFSDGCCEPTNPNGNMGLGAAILDENDLVIWEYSFAIFRGELGFYQTSNNVAEYLATIKLLTYIRDTKFSIADFTFFADSKLVVNQMMGEWGINGGVYEKYARMAFKLRDELESRDKSKLIFRWIGRDYNNHADFLSKNELKKRGCEFRIQKNG